MKPLPAPNVPGKTEAERFENAVKKIFSVSKEGLLKREAEWQRQPQRRQERRTGHSVLYWERSLAGR